MKVRTKKDVEILESKIKNDLGIDLQSYKNEEVVANFISLLVFPEYIINWTIRPILIVLVLYVLGFFFLDLFHIQYIIYGIVGLLLFILCGLLFGLLFLLSRLKTDVGEIANYSLDLMKTSVEDLNQVNSKINDENKKDVMNLLYKGIIHVVTIPMLSTAVSEKLPFIGGAVNGVIKKVLTLLSDRMDFDDIAALTSDQVAAGNKINPYFQSIDAASTGTETVMRIAFKIAKFPLKVFFVISMILLLLFLYFIH